LSRLLPLEVSFYLSLAASVIHSWWVGPRRPDYWGLPWIRSSRNLLRVLESHGMRVEVSGMRHLLQVDGPAVVAGNHMSTAEVLLMPSLLFPALPFVCVSKDSLARYPVFGPHLAASHSILVRRVNPREDLTVVLQEGSARLASGASVLVFPQATRTTDFSPQEFRSLGVKLARRAGVPIIPVAIDSRAWGNGKLVKDLGPIDPSLPVRFAFGAPIPVTGRGTEAHEACVAFIGDQLAAWRRSDDS
jgi:1-acyl-sn-glycerol-3-phosphate acyltransferase